jgi:uncharacterized protein YjdB
VIWSVTGEGGISVKLVSGDGLGPDASCAVAVAKLTPARPIITANTRLIPALINNFSALVH